MVRHPHFTQPIFVRFPRPAIMRECDGAERYPQAMFFLAQFRPVVLAHPATRAPATAVRTAPVDDPYGF